MTFGEHDIYLLPAQKFCKLAARGTFQVTCAFVHMTVEDTVRVALITAANEECAQKAGRGDRALRFE